MIVSHVQPFSFSGHVVIYNVQAQETHNSVIKKVAIKKTPYLQHFTYVYGFVLAHIHSCPDLRLDTLEHHGI